MSNNNNFNLDENTMNNIKNMVDNGNISDAISQISPDMIQNISKMLQNNSNNNGSSSSGENNNNMNGSNSTYSNHSSGNSNNANNLGSSISGFDFNNLDPNTIMKITSAFSKMNNKNDPRSNLLYSLKPYLRDNKKDKLDQYVNLLNITKIADILKDDKKENNNNG